jgi:hypothetical protein
VTAGRRVLRPPVTRRLLAHLALAAGYIGAGVVVTWPLPEKLTSGALIKVPDVSSYVWALWWMAHQVAHLGDPWFTHYMAAPVGVELGFDTLMPLPGLIMTPLTLAFGPAASFAVLTIVTPGLLCYVTYRLARLFLGQPGSVAAGAFFGLSTMAVWQDLYHLNISIGTLFLPMTLEAAIRLVRAPSRRRGIALGVVLGASVLTNQESAVVAVLLAAAVLVPWLARLGLGEYREYRERRQQGTPAEEPAGAALLRSGPAPKSAAVPEPGPAPAAVPEAMPAPTAGCTPAPAGRSAGLRPAALVVGVAALVSAVVASPQLWAMIRQVVAGGAAVSPSSLTQTYREYGVGLPTLFAPSPRLSHFHVGSLDLGHLAAGYTYAEPSEGIPTFGIVLTVLALAGLALAWRRRQMWGMALLWAAGAVLALGPTLILGTQTYVPLASRWHGVTVSLLMPYTWLVRIPGLSALREADRLALLGILGAAVLAGAAVQWLCRHLRPVLATLSIVVLGVAGFLEAGWSASGAPKMPATISSVDAPIAADHSHSIVVDVPFGLRGGVGLTGFGLRPQSLVLATADGHPRAISYTSWVPLPTRNGIWSKPFYRCLYAAQNGPHHLCTGQELTAAGRSASQLDVGWIIVWHRRLVASRPTVINYLYATGFKVDYQVHMGRTGITVWRHHGS